MTENPITPEDIGARWHPLSPEERAMAQALLSDAWAILGTKIPNLDTQPSSTSEAGNDLLRSVLCSAVIRVLRNPEGARSESIDNYSWTRDSSTSTGGLYFTDVELALLTGRKATALSTAFGDW